MGMTLQEEIEQAKQSVEMAEIQLQWASPEFEEVAWKRLDAAKAWLNALIAVAKRQAS